MPEEETGPLLETENQNEVRLDGEKIVKSGKLQMIMILFFAAGWQMRKPFIICSNLFLNDHTDLYPGLLNKTW